MTQQDDPTTGTVEDCTVEDCFIGILMANTDDAEVKNCKIKDANPTIFGPAAPQGIRVGFDEIGVSGITVEDNECTNAGVGILVFAGFEISDIEIEDNVCNDGNRGILTVLMVDSKVEGNTCNGNTLFGMAFNDSDDNEIEDNECNDNGLRGLVLVFGSDGNEIEGNVCNDNGQDGISLFLGANVNNEIEDNEATGNGRFDCFHNAASTPNTWEDNECDTSSGADIG